MNERDDRPEHPDRPESDAVGGVSGEGVTTADGAGPDAAAVRAAFVDDVGGDVAALLGDADLWADPSAGLADRIVADVATGGSDPAGAREGVAGADAVATTVPVREGPLAVAADRLWSWRQLVLGGAAALVLLVAGVTLLSAFGDAGDEEVFTLELVSTGRIDDAAGDVTVTTTESGIRVSLDAPSLPAREGDLFYEGWLRTDDDLLVPIGTFRSGDGVVLWAGVGLERVAGLSITLEEAAAAESADQASSGAVVLEVDFPSR